MAAVGSNAIEMWPLERLRPHPENAAIFDEPGESGETLATLLASMKKNGIWEPLLVKPDGTILAGHLRRACAEKLGLKEVPVRVWEVASYLDEVTVLIRSNTDRRQLTKREIGLAFKRLKELPRERGGTGGKMGRKAKGEMSAGSSGHSESREAAAEQLGVPRNVAEACATVFTTKGVPDEVKDAVNAGRVAPTTAAKEIRAELARQGGELTSPTPLLGLVRKKPDWDTRPDEEKRLEAQARKYQESYARLVKAHREIDVVLTATPLASLLGPTEHQEYRDVLRGIALRVAREFKRVESAVRKPKLTVVEGGKE